MLRECEVCDRSFHYFSDETCPHCRDEETRPHRPLSFQETLDTCWQLLRSPKKFMHQNQSGLRHLDHATLLAWGIVSTVVGVFLMSLWEAPLQGVDKAPGSIWSYFHWVLWSIALAPFWVPLSVWLRTIWVTAGLWLVGLFGKSRWRRSANIVAASQVSTLWMMVPWLGPVIALFSRFLILLHGCENEYQLSRTRATFVLISPALALGVLLLFIAFLFLIVFTALLSGAFALWGMEKLPLGP